MDPRNVQAPAITRGGTGCLRDHAGRQVTGAANLAGLGDIGGLGRAAARLQVLLLGDGSEIAALNDHKTTGGKERGLEHRGKIGGHVAANGHAILGFEVDHADGVFDPVVFSHFGAAGIVLGLGGSAGLEQVAETGVGGDNGGGHEGRREGEAGEHFHEGKLKPDRLGDAAE